MDEKTKTEIIKLISRVTALENLLTIVSSRLVQKDEKTLRSILDGIPSRRAIEKINESFRPSDLPSFLQEGSADRIFVDVFESVFENFKSNLVRIVDEHSAKIPSNTLDS